MITLNSSKTSELLSRGVYNIAPNLNGGSATLEYRPETSSTWYAVDSSSVTDLLGENYNLPECEIRITSITGNPSFEITVVEY
jgi:hypothetical protein